MMLPDRITLINRHRARVNGYSLLHPLRDKEAADPIAMHQRDEKRQESRGNKIYPVEVEECFCPEQYAVEPVK